MKKKTIWITQTAVLTALLVVLQAVTRGFGQVVTGSCVNAVLALAALTAGLASGLTVALLSPVFAFFLGIGPQLLPLVAAIAAGNAVFVAILWAVAGKRGASWPRRLMAWAVAAVCKFLVLYLVVVQFLCRILPLSEKQTATFSVMFSWTQLVTALIGGAIALLAAPAIQKALQGRGGTA